MRIAVENYIVRIYRREADDPDKVVGTVERAETQEKKPFHGLPALSRMLSSPDAQGSGDGNRRLDSLADTSHGVETKTG
jgi:hypothetical protein